MKEEFCLSDHIWYEGQTDERTHEHLNIKRVKEFIRLLKEINTKQWKTRVWTSLSDEELNKEIDKLAGDKLL